MSGNTQIKRRNGRPACRHRAWRGSEPEIRWGGRGSERRPLPPGQAACMEDKPWTKHTARPLPPHGPGGTVAKLAAQWLRRHTSTAGIMGSIPGQRTELSPATWCGQNTKCICARKVQNRKSTRSNGKPSAKARVLRDPHSRTENIRTTHFC